MARRGDTHRLIRWLWTSRRPDARLVAAGPAARVRPSGAAPWRCATMAYAAAGPGVRDLPLPVGRGRQPHGRRLGQDADRKLDRARTTWRTGCTPGILLRGYGGDEILVHQHAGARGRRGRRSRPRRRRGAGARRGRAGAGARRCVPAARRPPRPQHRGGERRDDPRGAAGRCRPGPGARDWHALDRADARDRHPEAGRRRRRRMALAARAAPTGSGARSPSRISGVRALEGLVSGTASSAGDAGRQAGGRGLGDRAIRTPSSRRPRRPAPRCRWPPGRITTTIATRTWPGWRTRPAGPTTS